MAKKIKEEGIFDKKFKEILSFQIVSIIGGLIAGTVLAVYLDKLLLIPGMFILIPGILEMRGNISGPFTSRISSGLFLKVIKPFDLRTKIIKGNLVSSFLLTGVVSVFLGLLAFLLTFVVFNQSAPQLVLIALIAGILANVVEIPIALFLTFFLFKKGHDPNNIMGPVITSVGDILGILALLIAAVII
jgi:mgtE-like transporter